MPGQAYFAVAKGNKKDAAAVVFLRVPKKLAYGSGNMKHMVFFSLSNLGRAIFSFQNRSLSVSQSQSHCVFVALFLSPSVWAMSEHMVLWLCSLIVIGSASNAFTRQIFVFVPFRCTVTSSYLSETADSVVAAVGPILPFLAVILILFSSCSQTFVLVSSFQTRTGALACIRSVRSW